jgi:pimeloyl-ACP methyl ester carboxylesterase
VSERVVAARDGLRLFVRDEGKADGALPLLCLPGLARNGRDFDELAARLAPTRRVVRLDYRGRGRSERAADWRSYAPEIYLDDIRQTVCATGLGRFVVVGTSLGGLLGMALALSMPAALAGLIVNDVGPDVRADGRARILEYVGRDRPQPDWDAAVAELKRIMPTVGFTAEAQWRAAAERTFVGGADGRLHVDWDPMIVEPLRRGGVPGDLWRLWRAVGELPVLLIRGARSDVLSAATFDRMVAAKPDVAAVVLPGAGHAPTLDEPESREAIDEFLRRRR